MNDSANSADDLIQLLAGPLADLTYHLDDIAASICSSSPDVWRSIASRWSEQDTAWKSNASMIVDQLGVAQSTFLLRSLIDSNNKEDVSMVATLVAQIGHDALGDLLPPAAERLKWASQAFPDLGNYLHVCAKAGGITLSPHE